MANTYTQIYIQSVFAVQNRETLIHPSWEDSLYKYITGVVKNKGHKLLAINGMPDHIHFFMGLKPSGSISDLIREIKKSSNLFIKHNGFVKSKFQWQEGFGAFSYGQSQIDHVINYIGNQKEYHKKTTFRNEYLAFLERFDVDFNERYI